MIEQLLETWSIHNRINLFLLESIPSEALEISPPGGKGRGIGEQFFHLHKVRLMWFKEAAPALLEGLEELEKEDAGSMTKLAQCLIDSGERVEQLLRIGLNENKIKGFKPHPVAFLGYLISHESHHRGQIALLAKQLGFPLNKKTAYGMWEWGVR
ncbi:hypothetical protein GE107_25950 [Cohnella sp. CFH 77786]|uniref:DinB family protein n=1 Tax=Cohnella sp. CFH 77786 TaxID=2662265 RepID=UPI001C608FBB|nr:DinB family protein [Cohnella sp. CFH 77786]MBW5449458.1 hypothetical protein [Cohnella sp. CFH 77786]